MPLYNGGRIGSNNDPFTGTKSDDPNYSSVSLLLNGNGTNGSTTFTDSSSYSHTVSAYGNAQISTTQSKFGGSSMYFDGNGDYLALTNDASFVFGTGDFTVEMWVYHTSQDSQKIYYDGRPSSTNGPYVALYKTPQNKLALFVNTANRIVGTTSILQNAWYHIAVCRQGSSTKLFLNGIQEGSTFTDTTNYLNNGTLRPIIGADGADPSQFTQMYGYIDDLRVTKGVARYTSNFTPPTAQLPGRETGTFASGLWTLEEQSVAIRNELWPGFVLPIVTNGLVLHLDPGDSASYPGSGTTWTDLSGNGNNATLYNTPTHNASTNGGIFSFNKSQSEYAVIPGNYSTTTSTVIAFARYTNTSANGRVISANNNWLMGWHANTIDKYYPVGWVSSTSGSTGTTDWICYAATGNSSVDQWELYKNGTSFVGPNAGGSQGPNTINLARYAGGEYADCEIGVVLVYNRILTASEITQNFDALKGRYGL